MTQRYKDCHQLDFQPSLSCTTFRNIHIWIHIASLCEVLCLTCQLQTHRQLINTMNLSVNHQSNGNPDLRKDLALGVFSRSSREKRFLRYLILVCPEMLPHISGRGFPESRWIWKLYFINTLCLKFIYSLLLLTYYILRIRYLKPQSSCSPGCPPPPPPVGVCLCFTPYVGITFGSISVPSQAEVLRGRLQDLENLLTRFDCRSRSGRHPPYPGGPAAEHQREDGLPNALEDFLAFQGAVKPPAGLNPGTVSHTAAT